MTYTKKALATGNAIDLANPDGYTFDIHEIASLLSNIKRFNGIGIDVAKHSCYVARNIFVWTGNPYLALRGLLHDASEAYIGDVATPVKYVLNSSWANLEYSVQRAIERQLAPNHKYNLATEPMIKTSDMLQLKRELHDLVLQEEYVKGSHGLWGSLDKFPNIDTTSDWYNHIGTSDSETIFTHMHRDLCQMIVDGFAGEERTYNSPIGEYKCFIDPTYETNFNRVSEVFENGSARK